MHLLRQHCIAYLYSLLRDGSYQDAIPLMLKEGTHRPATDSEGGRAAALDLAAYVLKEDVIR